MAERVGHSVRAPCSGLREKEVAQLLTDDLQGEILLHPLSGDGSQPVRQRLVVEQPTKGSRKGLRVLAGHDDAAIGLASRQDIRHAWRIGSDDRQSARHGLQHRHCKALAAGWDRVEVGGGQIRPELMAIEDVSINPSGLLAGCESPAERVRVAAASHEQQENVVVGAR